MAFAGPAANVLLALLAALAIHVGLWTGFFVSPESVSFTQIVNPAGQGVAEGLAKLLSLMFALNVLLAAFNLIPIPPLDGFSAAGLLMSEDRARRLEELGHTMKNFSYVGLLISWQLFGALYDPLFNFSLLVLYPGEHYS